MLRMEGEFAREPKNEEWRRGDVVEVTYNAQYGGFTLSDEAEALFYELAEREGRAARENCNSIYNVPRHDPVLVSVVKGLGAKASGFYSDIRLKVIPRKYQDHYDVGEYDGLETVLIDFKGYKLWKIQEILDWPGSSEEREGRIREVLGLELERGLCES